MLACGGRMARPRTLPSPCSALAANLGRMLSCYMCGLKFGQASLPIHLKACPRKREVRRQQRRKTDDRALLG